MPFLTGAALVLAILVAAAGIAFGRVLSRVPDRAAQRKRLAALPILALIPLLYHFARSVPYLASYGPPGQMAAGFWPGLIAFVAGVLGATVLLMAAARPLANKAPLALALVPPLAFVLYFAAIRNVAASGPHGVIQVDNVPMVFLFSFHAGATVFVAACAWAAVHGRRRPDA